MHAPQHRSTSGTDWRRQQRQEIRSAYEVWRYSSGRRENELVARLRGRFRAGPLGEHLHGGLDKEFGREADRLDIDAFVVAVEPVGENLGSHACGEQRGAIGH